MSDKNVLKYEIYYMYNFKTLNNWPGDDKNMKK
jgi:hypothetical protein